jgi:hypothetical protein
MLVNEKPKIAMEAPEVPLSGSTQFSVVDPLNFLGSSSRVWLSYSD